MPRELSPGEVDEITAAIYAGRKLEAIKLYRAATGDGLAAAKQIVEGIESRLRVESPEKFSASQPVAAKPVLLVLLLMAAIAAALFLFRR